MKDKIFGVLQRIGRSFMLPVAVLPVAGLLLGLGGSFTNQTMIETYGLQAVLGDGTVLFHLLTIMSKVGSAIFGNLPLIFAIGVAIGMAKKEREVAALAAAISFFVMHVSINSMLIINGMIDGSGFVADWVPGGTIGSIVGITTLEMGVFGGIIVGLGVAALHNRYYTIQMPNALSFFGGTRFVPIISTIVYTFVGIGMYFVWPPIQNGILALGSVVTGTGYFGTFLFGLIKRALIPFGLHHVFYLPFWQTAVGGTMEIGGKLIQGGQNIFFAQLADPTVKHFSADATRYFSGEFIFMIFGFPGAALAMYRTAKPERKKIAGGLLLSAALTSALTGITEPIEFSFLFVAPALFGVHVVLGGLAYMLAQMFNIAVGLTFSGGFIDLLLFGILQGNAKTSWLLIIPLGIIYFFLYYFIFYFMIKKFDFKTPGREDGEVETKLYTKADVQAKKAGTAGGAHDVDPLSVAITKGLGGPDNISDVDCCATRLRITVFDGNKVDKDALKATGAAGVVTKGNGIQIIYGPRVTGIKTNLETYLENPIAIEEIAEEPKETPVSEPVTTSSASDQGPKPGKVVIPFDGEVITLEKVADGVFSEKMMGDGFAVIPKTGLLHAPVDGKVEMIFDTKHALSITTPEGIEVLVHMGLDTVGLKGEGFELNVKVGDTVKAGDPIAVMSLEFIKSKKLPVVTPVLFTNYEGAIRVDQGPAKAGEEGRVHFD